MPDEPDPNDQGPLLSPAGDVQEDVMSIDEPLGASARAEAEADLSWSQSVWEFVDVVKETWKEHGFFGEWQSGSMRHGGRRGPQAFAGAVQDDPAAQHDANLRMIRGIMPAALQIMQATNPDNVEEAALNAGKLNRYLNMKDARHQLKGDEPQYYERPAQETGSVLADSYGPYHPEYRPPSIAVDRAPGISGGAITNVSNNFGGLMILAREDGTYNSGDWDGRLTVKDGAALLAAHREEDDNGRRAWIYNDEANDGKGDVLSQEEMAEYYENPSDDKWKGMHVIMSAEGGYYEVFENPVQGLRGAIENTNSRIVRYGEKTPGQLIAAWAPESENPVGSEVTYSQRIARLVGIKADGEIDPTNWQHMAGVILAMAGHEAGRENAPAISAEVLYEALQASQMATGRVVDGQVTVRFGREDGHGMGDFSLEDVQDLLDRLAQQL